MNCGPVEDLLSRFVEGDLAREENLAVKEHLASCERCRVSYEAYSALEDSLVGLKEELPSSKIMADRIVRQLGLGRRKRIALGALRNVHAVTSLVMIAGSIIFFLRRETMIRSLTGISSRYIDAFIYFSKNLVGWILRMAGGETWVLLTVYMLLTSLIILTGGLMYRRFARE